MTAVFISLPGWIRIKSATVEVHLRLSAPAFPPEGGAGGLHTTQAGC